MYKEEAKEFSVEEFLRDKKDYVKAVKKYNLKYAIFDSQFNLYKCPINKFYFTDEDINKFNEIYSPIGKYYESEHLHKTELTKSGGVSVRKDDTHNYVNRSSMIVRQSRAGVDIVIITGFVVRLQFGLTKKEAPVLPGSYAFKEFKKMCDDMGVDISKYSTTKKKCEEIKKEIPKYDIAVKSKSIKFGTVIPNCYHIDFHSSFASGLANSHKEFRPVIEKIYDKRLESGIKIFRGKEISKKDYWKSVLNSTIGYMQSINKNRHFYPTLTRDSIQDNNDRINKIIENLKMQGYIPLLTNTDGVWYRKPNYIEEPYHDELEGNGIGQWSSEYENAELRIFSPGSYDFRYPHPVNGDWVYEVRSRGLHACEIEYPRKNWTWEENMLSKENNYIIKYVFNEDSGIERIEDNEKNEV